MVKGSVDEESMTILHYYRKTEAPHSLLPSVQEQLKALQLDEDAATIVGIETESCFNVQLTSDLSDLQRERLEWLLAETFEKDGLRLETSHFDDDTTTTSSSASSNWMVEFGPRMTFSSAFSSNAVSICMNCNLPVTRLELSRRYRFVVGVDGGRLSDKAVVLIKSMLHDRMTEEEYLTPLTTFDSGAHPEPVSTVPIMEQGRAALEKINAERGLGFDDFDLDYYTKLFKVSSCPCRSGIYCMPLGGWVQRSKLKSVGKKYAPVELILGLGKRVSLLTMTMINAYFVGFEPCRSTTIVSVPLHTPRVYL
jgi:phosphoribosylformylglycinamidine synthase